jgi:hypothetical protein
MRLAAAGREPPRKTPAASSFIHEAGTAGYSGSAGKGAATLTAVGTAASSAATVLGAGSALTNSLYPVDHPRTTDLPSRLRRTSRNVISPVRVRWRGPSLARIVPSRQGARGACSREDGGSAADGHPSGEHGAQRSGGGAGQTPTVCPSVMWPRRALLYLVAELSGVSLHGIGSSRHLDCLIRRRGGGTSARLRAMLIA